MDWCPSGTRSPNGATVTDARDDDDAAIARVRANGAHDDADVADTCDDDDHTAARARTAAFSRYDVAVAATRDNTDTRDDANTAGARGGDDAAAARVVIDREKWGARSHS